MMAQNVDYNNYNMFEE
jgi:hypothetical protein